MELLETQDPEKKRLIETSERHKRELEKQVKAISDQTEKVFKNTLIIGGSLVLTYFLVSQLGSAGKKRKKGKSKAGKTEDNDDANLKSDESPAPPSFLSQIGERVVMQATAILIGIAKEKLAEFLSKHKQEDEDS